MAREVLERSERRRGQAFSTIALCLGLASGCASSGTGANYDPFEPVNRGVFWFNDKVDRYFLEPIAIGYDWIAPDFFQDRVSLFVANLRFPVDLVNNLLQGKPSEAGEETLRFLTNSTVGLGGLFDPATQWFELGEHNEDFGQTFAVWGLPAGPYLVIPFLGSSNVRDGLGQFPDSFGNGAVYLFNPEALIAYNALRIVNLRAQLLEQIEVARKASLDYYAFTRSAYWQLRESQIADGRPARGDSEDESGEDDLYDDSLYDDSLYDDVEETEGEEE